jgi:hypothetical protein
LDSDVAGDINVGEKLPKKLFSIMDSVKMLFSSFSFPNDVHGKEKDGKMSSLEPKSSFLT